MKRRRPPDSRDGVRRAADQYPDLLASAWSVARDEAVDAGIQKPEIVDPSIRFEQFKNDPARFARRVLGHGTWHFQRYMMRAVLEHRFVTVRSAKKTGKTFGCADLVAHFMCTEPSLVLTTGPGDRQVKELLWGAIGSNFRKARWDLPGKIDTKTWRIDPEWKAIGFATDDPNAMQGFHAGIDAAALDDEEEEEQDELANAGRNPGEAADALAKFADGRRLLWIVDEAPGVKGPLWEIVEASLSGDNTYALVPGNPTLTDDDPHFFAGLHQPGSRFHRIHVSARPFPPEWDAVGCDKLFDHVPAALIDDAWIEEMKKKWGEDGPLTRALIYGCFADASMGGNRVMPRALLDSALAREGSSPQGRHIGVDVAETRDRCIASLWIDGVKCAYHQLDTAGFGDAILMRVADVIVTLAKKWKTPAANVHIDPIGVGAGVRDRLRQLGYYIDAVDFGAPPVGDWSRLIGEEPRMKNRRAELHWVLRRAFEEGLGHLPRKWEDSWREAQWAQYELRQEGNMGTVLRIEPKDEIKVRHGRSPDFWDSDLLAWSRTNAAIRPRVVRR